MKNVLMIVGLFLAVSVVILTSIVSLQCRGQGETATPPSASHPASQPATATAPAAAAPAGASMTDAAAKAHGQLAVIALSDVKVLVARKKYDQAGKLAREALRQYIDTPLAADFQQLAESAAAQAQAQKEAAATQSAQSQAELQARQERFLAYRDQALAAYNAGDFPNAIVLFQNALQEESDAQAQAMLDQAIAHVSKPRLAVLDFAVEGDIGIPNVGRAVAELLLTKIDARAFQLVEQSRLADLLAKQGLTVPQLGNNPQVLQGEGLAIVRYLVMGSIIRTDDVVTLAGRMVDAQTGQVVNTAQVRINSPADLPPAVGELAALLQMSPEQKAQYLQDKQQADRQAAAAAAQQQAVAEARQRHLQAGADALNQVRGLLAAGDLYNAAMLSRQYAADYGDTPMARDFVDVLAMAEMSMNQQGYQGGIIIVAGGNHGRLVVGGNGSGLVVGGNGHGGRDGDHGGSTRPGGSGPSNASAGDDRARRHEQFLQYQREGKQDMAVRDWPGAIGNFTRALAFEDDGEARQMLGVCAGQQEQAQKRQAQYEDVMSKGGRAEAAGQWVLAMRYYEQSVALNPSEAAKAGLERAEAKVDATAARDGKNHPQGTAEALAVPVQSIAQPTAEPPVGSPLVESPLAKPAAAPAVTKPALAAGQEEEKSLGLPVLRRTVTKEPAATPIVFPPPTPTITPAPTPTLTPIVPPTPPPTFMPLPATPPVQGPMVMPPLTPSVPLLPIRPLTASEPARSMR